MRQDEGVAPRYPSMLTPPLVLASVGVAGASVQEMASVLSPELAPATFGFEGGVWLTADGHAVVHHEAVVRAGLRRRPLAELRLLEVPDTVVTLEQLLQAGAGGAHVVLSTDDDATAAAVAAGVSADGADVAGRVWLRAGDREQAASWRSLSTDIRLVESTRLRRLDTGPERRAAALASAGIDAVQLPEGDWTPGLTTLFHRFGRLAFAGPAAHRRQLDALLDIGVDAVSSDHVERLVEARAALESPPTTGPDRSAATP